jgi:peptidoglycan/LPS O-acetylase OafA/YrhL
MALYNLPQFFDGLRSKKKLDAVMRRGGNNFDLIRLLAAIAVIYGHAFALIQNSSGSDLFKKVFGIYAGEWGLKTFFFLSGLLVVNSVLTTKGPIQYLIQRFFRIWPALAFVVLSTTLILGPLCTTLSLNDYFSSDLVWHYLRRALTFQFWGSSYGLPGVFAANHYKTEVNAPLWTLSIEVFAYLCILALFLVGAFNKKIAPWLFLLFLLDTLLPERLIFFWLPKNSFDFSSIPFCFAIGGILAIYKDKVSVSASLAFGFLLLCYLFRGWTHHTYIVYTFVFVFTLYIASLDKVINLPQFPDISYGTYLWGWPVQQTLSHFFPTIQFWPYFLATLAITLTMAYLSWRIIENRSMRFGKKLNLRLLG